jgi:hypothetical protein
MDASVLKTAQASMYAGTMTVYEVLESSADATTGLPTLSDDPKYTDTPCRVSYKTVNADDQSESGSVVQEISLYCDPALVIKTGSKIVVTQNGTTVKYQLSGQPAVYVSHQEIPLRLYEEYA